MSVDVAVALPEVSPAIFAEAGEVTHGMVGVGAAESVS